jgi:hypothetical protein
MAVPLSVWLAPSILGTILLALFGYVVTLTREIGSVKESVAKMQGTCTASMDAVKASTACFPEVKRTVDRLVYRQELADQQAAAGLHAPTHHERDTLVDELMAKRLDADGLRRVIELLQEAQVKERTADNRLRAIQLMQRAQTELRGLEDE